ncbi:MULTISPECIES: hypothetical protein [Methylocaldum]|uniref:hypothetical protein n=1 Tax=Methylocaldum sp. GT1TLB TaxID=3438965 RepID=UPI0012EC716E|nr:hypothetical protein [Methylocaldum sp. BRCS4]
MTSNSLAFPLRFSRLAFSGASLGRTLLKRLRDTVIGVPVAVLLFTLQLNHAVAAPAETTSSGSTTVRLAPEFVQALNDLGVTPDAISPAQLRMNSDGVRAIFPITTGVVDLEPVRAEIDHSGGLSLTAGDTRVELSSFIIDLTGDRPVLTGLVVANDDLVARLPLFDLSLEAAKVDSGDDVLTVEEVKVTLSEEAASALNQQFGVQAFTKGFPIGQANVRAVLGSED